MALLMGWSISAQNQDMTIVKEKSLKTFLDSVSYAVGQDMYSNWENQHLGFDYNKVIKGLKNCMDGKVVFTPEQIGEIMQRYQVILQERARAEFEKNVADGKKFIEEVRNNKSVYATESGLCYRRVKAGNGKKPTINDQVKVHYTGKLIDGKVFDSSVERKEPITFPLNAVIPGWTEGLQLMDEGSKYILYIPQNLGYGDRAVGAIPAGSTLVFEVELLEINPQTK